MYRYKYTILIVIRKKNEVILLLLSIIQLKIVSYETLLKYNPICFI